MRVLLTGATGFIGWHALEPLLQSGAEVHAVARHTGELNYPQVAWHAVDLLQQGAAQSLCRSLQPTHLLHFGWYAEPGRFWNSEENLRWVGATLELFRAFATHGGERFVGAGTCAEYLWDGRPSREDSTPLIPSSLYGTCKAASFQILAEAAQTLSVSFAWGRIFHLYGPREPQEKLVASVVNALLSGVPIDCTDGMQTRDFLMVEDVASAFVHLLFSDCRGAVNIGSGTATTLADFLRSAERLTGTDGLVHLGARTRPAGDPDVLLPDIDKLFRLGWRPRYDFESGMRATIAWWNSQRFTRGHFKPEIG